MFHVPRWEKFQFLLITFLTLVVAYPLGYQIWHAGAIFPITVGLWGPTLMLLVFGFFVRIFRVKW